MRKHMSNVSKETNYLKNEIEILDLKSTITEM